MLGKWQMSVTRVFPVQTDDRVCKWKWERKLIAGDLQKLNADCTLKDKMNQWIY